MVFTRYLSIAGLVLLPSLAFADVPPDADPYQACDGLALDAACTVSTPNDFYEGTCVEENCPDKPDQKCNVCREPVVATGTGGGTGGDGTGGGTAGPDTSTGGSTGGTAGPDTGTGGTAGPDTTSATGSATGGDTAGVATTGDGPATGTTAATEAGSSSGDEPKDSKSGCDCRSSDASGGLLALLGLTLVRRRRRRA